MNYLKHRIAPKSTPTLMVATLFAMAPLTHAFGTPHNSPFRQNFIDYSVRPAVQTNHVKSRCCPLFAESTEPSKERYETTSQTSKESNLPPRLKINPWYLLLATAETIYWYYLTPGIDPNTPWFNPADGKLIATLLDPEIVTRPPPASGLGFSSLLLNIFLILPVTWALFLLQEDGKTETNQRQQVISPWPFCLAGLLVGGGALIPYMVVRKAVLTREEINPRHFSPLLKNFEQEGVGPIVLTLLLAVIFTTFLAPFLLEYFREYTLDVDTYTWSIEWDAFVQRTQSSQFTALALFDATMLSATMLDPMADDARRRGVLKLDATPWEVVKTLAPFWMVPVVGPVLWIWKRPKFEVRQKEE